MLCNFCLHACCNISILLFICIWKSENLIRIILKQITSYDLKLVFRLFSDPEIELGWLFVFDKCESLGKADVRVGILSWLLLGFECWGNSRKFHIIPTFRQVSWTMDKYDLQAIGIPQEQAKQFLKILFDPLYSSAKHDFLFYFGGRSCIRTTFQQHIFPYYRLEAFEVLHNNFSAAQRFWHRSLLVMYLFQRRKVRRR